MTSTTGDLRLQALGSQLHTLSWTIHRVLPSAAGLDPLPTSELAVLKRVIAEPGMTVSELTTALGLRQSNASAAVRALVDRGLVHRKSSPSDRRLALLHPTEAALKNKRLLEEAWSGSICAAMMRLPADQVNAILGAAKALAALEEQLRAGLTTAP
ncbi:MarR family transcriptional regulator [Arthrobacter sp. PAMC25564]|uniref:MarR family winged helix-turn-helix transcriptional regulator n=1 Tax=Arthrobacter sp. PAMC25564 TaxID=2565366 RepID=UPI0010A26DD0|nr:MarR family transcriptional regulator [Arthrobacter sp. PAMC25564]QCB96395.1 MarR family transcriptional regulator [Arthrobacter sp. PAMC25564]